MRPTPAPTAIPATTAAPATSQPRPAAPPPPPTPTPRGYEPPPPPGSSPVPTATLASPLLGEWAFRGHVPDREIGGNLRFWNQNGKLAGAYVAPNGRSTPISNITVDGEKVSFGIVGSLGTWSLVGVMSGGNRMQGTFETISRVVPWDAVKGTGPAAPPPPPAAPPASSTPPPRG
jgi:hypothetical protein